jgi:hypothetical protein
MRGLRTFGGNFWGDKVAPIPDLPALAPEQVSTLSSRSLRATATVRNALLRSFAKQRAEGRFASQFRLD